MKTILYTVIVAIFGAVALSAPTKKMEAVTRAWVPYSVQHHDQHPAHPSATPSPSPIVVATAVPVPVTDPCAGMSGSSVTAGNSSGCASGKNTLTMLATQSEAALAGSTDNTSNSILGTAQVGQNGGNTMGMVGDMSSLATLFGFLRPSASPSPMPSPVM